MRQPLLLRHFVALPGRFRVGLDAVEVQLQLILFPTLVLLQKALQAPRQPRLLRKNATPQHALGAAHPVAVLELCELLGPIPRPRPGGIPTFAHRQVAAVDLPEDACSDPPAPLVPLPTEYHHQSVAEDDSH